MIIQYWIGMLTDAMYHRAKKLRFLYTKKT